MNECQGYGSPPWQRPRGSAKSGMWGSTCGDGSQRARVRAQSRLSGSLPARSRLSSRPGQRGLAVRLPAIRRHSARDSHVSTGASAQLKRLISDFADPLGSALRGLYRPLQISNRRGSWQLPVDAQPAVRSTELSTACVGWSRSGNDMRQLFRSPAGSWGASGVSAQLRTFCSPGTCKDAGQHCVQARSAYKRAVAGSIPAAPTSCSGPRRVHRCMGAQR